MPTNSYGIPATNILFNICGAGGNGVYSTNSDYRGGGSGAYIGGIARYKSRYNECSYTMNSITMNPGYLYIGYFGSDGSTISASLTAGDGGPGDTSTTTDNGGSTIVDIYYNNILITDDTTANIISLAIFHQLTYLTGVNGSYTIGNATGGTTRFTGYTCSGSGYNSVACPEATGMIISGSTYDTISPNSQGGGAGTSTNGYGAGGASGDYGDSILTATGAWAELTPN